MTERQIVPTNDDGERVDKPLRYGKWKFYPDGRIEHVDGKTVKLEQKTDAQGNDIIGAGTVETSELSGDVTGGNKVTNLPGANLSISNGNLDASAGFAPGKSSSPSYTFGNWRTPDSNNAVLVVIGVYCQTSGTSVARIDIEVDESGGTTADYTFYARADTEPGDGFAVDENFLLVIPAGRAYKITNASDPKGNNQIRDIREFTP